MTVMHLREKKNPNSITTIYQFIDYSAVSFGVLL